MSKKTFRMLRSMMYMEDVTVRDIAYKLKINVCTAYRKFARQSPWTLTEMYTIMDMVKADSALMGDLFPKED